MEIEFEGLKYNIPNTLPTAGKYLDPMAIGSWKENYYGQFLDLRGDYSFLDVLGIKETDIQGVRNKVTELLESGPCEENPHKRKALAHAKMLFCSDGANSEEIEKIANNYLKFHAIIVMLRSLHNHASGLYLEDFLTKIDASDDKGINKHYSLFRKFSSEIIDVMFDSVSEMYDITLVQGTYFDFALQYNPAHRDVLDPRRAADTEINEEEIATKFYSHFKEVGGNYYDIFHNTHNSPQQALQSSLAIMGDKTLDQTPNVTGFVKKNLILAREEFRNDGGPSPGEEVLHTVIVATREGFGNLETYLRGGEGTLRHPDKDFSIAEDSFPGLPR